MNEIFSFVGCFTRDLRGPIVRINNKMTACMYRDILSEHMLPFAQDRLVDDFLFQQDNDPKHTSILMLGGLRRVNAGRGKLRFKIVRGFFNNNGIKLLKTPAYSPDLNPIEHMWAKIKQTLRGTRFQTHDQLWKAVQDIWSKIPIDYMIKLVDSMPHRINAVIRAKGWHTKY